MLNTYEKLAKYLDTLPAGYPAAPDGLELRILERLFTPAEAELALHLTLLGQDVRVISRQTGLGEAEATDLLENMLRKGLISTSHSKENGSLYGISQFVIGFYEGQVNRLDENMAKLFEDYAPIWFEHSAWKKVPQLRTIPVKRVIPITHAVMPYMQMDEIVRANEDIAVRNCVCRQEQRVLGKGCDRPMETCMTFGSAARSTVENGIGRMVSKEEAMQIVNTAQHSGLVLQPANSQNPMVVCMCCSCCCGVLRQIKADPNPGKLVANPYVTQYNQSLCISCFACVEICPMAALTEDAEGMVSFTEERCIGCGLCVGICPSEALELVERADQVQLKIPKNTINTYISLSRARGPENLIINIWTIIRSFVKQILPR